MDKANLVNFGSAADRQRLIAALPKCAERLSLALRNGSDTDVLKALAGLPQQIISADRAAITQNVVEHILSKPVWQRRGVTPVQGEALASGGYTWIAKVRRGDQLLALSIPKCQSNDYNARLATRVEMSRLVPRNIPFQVPRITDYYTDPFASCLMTYIPGRNCYGMTFDSGGQALSNGEGIGTSRQVFETLGHMAAVFTSVKGQGFGPIINPTCQTLKDHLQPIFVNIREMILGSSAIATTPYGFSKDQVAEILSWVEQDCASPREPRLVHPDLSPWNALYEPVSRSWAITDGDDAFFGTTEQQIGVCLMSMRGNLRHEWVRAIVQGFEPQGRVDAGRNLIKGGAAYGAITYGLNNAALPYGPAPEAARDMALRFVAPLVKLFYESQG